MFKDYNRLSQSFRYRKSTKNNRYFQMIIYYILQIHIFARDWSLKYWFFLSSMPVPMSLLNCMACKQWLIAPSYTLVDSFSSKSRYTNCFSFFFLCQGETSMRRINHPRQPVQSLVRLKSRLHARRVSETRSCCI